MTQNEKDFYEGVKDLAEKHGVRHFVLAYIEPDKDLPAGLISSLCVGTPQSILEMSARLMGAARGTFEKHMLRITDEAKMAELRRKDD